MKSKSFGFWFFGFCLLIMYFPAPSHPCLCLLLGSTFKCPEPPSCCESGYYALDECGCCMKCAKAELQKCGGASGISGRCGQGLQCLKTCFSCRTVGDSGLPCVFPFTYQNETYNKCTSRDSDTGQPWCATAVDEDGAVVDYAWGDCGEGCPGTNLECDEKYFSIQEGVCIDVSVPGAIPNWIGAPTVKLEPSTEVLFPAPVCKNKGARREYENTCRCDRGETALDFDIQGVPRGNCTGLDEDERDNLDKVWCFLENIRDPQDPRSGCYSDTRWSARDGRFWSALACTQDPDVNSSQDLLASAPTFTSNLGQNLPQVKSRPTPGPTRAPPTTAIASTTTVATTTVATTTESTTEHQTKIPEPAEPAEPAEHAEPAEPAEHARTTNLELQQKGLDDDIYDIVFNPQDSAEFDYEEYDAAVESENKAANSPDHSNGLESDYEEANLVREEDRTSGISRLDSELTRGTATRANFNFVHDDQEEEMEDEGLEEEKDGGPVDDHTDSIVSESGNHKSL